MFAMHHVLLCKKDYLFLLYYKQDLKNIQLNWMQYSELLVFIIPSQNE